MSVPHRLVQRAMKKRAAAERRAAAINLRLYADTFGDTASGAWCLPVKPQIEPIARSEIVETLRVSLEAHVRSSNRTMIEPILRLVEKALDTEGDEPC